MKRLYSSQDLIQVAQLKAVLEREGIPCVVRNEILAGLAPEIPFAEAFPELWVQNDSDLPRAEKIKGDWKVPPTAAAISTWLCENCGEKLEGQFSSCWKCGAARPDHSTVA